MSDSAIRILIMEDSPTDSDLLLHALRDGLTLTFESVIVDTLEDAIQVLSSPDEFGLVIMDLNLPDSTGIATFERLIPHTHQVPVVILSGVEDLHTATESVRLGAQDYVVKGGTEPRSFDRIVRLAMERNRRITAERERDHANHEMYLAREIQQSLYPSVGPQIDNYDIAGSAQAAARVCGDYYDFISITQQTYGIAVGDVCGHGLPAALTMLQIRACLRLLANQQASPDDVLKGVNDFLPNDALRFASLFFGQLNLLTSQFTYASAGHAGYVLKPDGSTHVLEATAMVVGIEPDLQPCAVKTVDIISGDIIFIPTDGFEEAFNEQRQMFGKERLLSTIHSHREKSAAEIIQHADCVVRKYTGKTIPEDDMTCVIVKAH